MSVSWKGAKRVEGEAIMDAGGYVEGECEGWRDAHCQWGIYLRSGR